MARKKAAVAEEPTPAAKRPKQGHLPDMEPPSITEIDDAADLYLEARNAWQAKHQPMMEAHAVLQTLLKQHKLKRYEYDHFGETFVAEVVANEKVRVKKKKDDEDDE